ncbi:UPF0481 protein At3g47200-like isoform X2 [Mercurialis annua]|uniref:UPF0481 protein At3g47200-like isoform X2 n=1 Tax=Mercurialis annua TaxID=3986 RepID=UPI002160888A|nr:UPF0481 protein At3g47200-like isoform X2 [Mercurialis annua]
MNSIITTQSNLPTKHSGNSSAIHVIDISSEAEKWISQLELVKNVEKAPKLLQKSAGNSSCCIFKVPQALTQINEKAYQPHAVSIGPYHHGSEHLEMIQQHKWRFLGSILNRTKNQGVGLKEFFKAVAPQEDKIRECYSEFIEFSSHKLVEIMVLDGCFIIELLFIVGKLVPANHDDPIFSMEWILSHLMRDLLRLENQIPFIVLQSLFDLIKVAHQDSRSLTELALEFFDYSIDRPIEVLIQYKDMKWKHLLDLFRLTFVPPPDFKYLLDKLAERSASNEDERDRFLQSIQPAMKLRRSGIKFEQRKSDSFLDIKFSHGVLSIPALTIDDFATIFLLNWVAFEQCYRHCNKYITSYVAFMCRLINTPEDAGYLSDHDIIENSYGTDDEVAKFFNDMGLRLQSTSSGMKATKTTEPDAPWSCTLSILQRV